MNSVLEPPVDTIDRLQRLLGDAVLVELLPPPTQTDSGLFIPDSAGQNGVGYEGALAGRLRQGIVIACGPGKRDKFGKLHPLEVQAGDRVTFYYMAEYDGLKWPTDAYMVMPERFIQSVLEG